MPGTGYTLSESLLEYAKAAVIYVCGSNIYIYMYVLFNTCAYIYYNYIYICIYTCIYMHNALRGLSIK